MRTRYPGDEYVDWTCLHGYNWGGNSWATFNQVFRGISWNPYDSYQQVVDIAPTKPMMIGEWASTEASDGGARKAARIRDALETQIPQRFPQIRAVVWFNWNERPGVQWMVESSAPATQAFASPIYTSNQFHTLDGGPVRPFCYCTWVPTAR